MPSRPSVKVAITRLYEFFEEQVARHPQHIAISFTTGSSVTYAELKRKVTHLASYMNGLTFASKRLAIILPICTDLIVAILSCLKTNCTYIPIDSSLPASYIKKIIDDIKPDYVLYNDEQMQQVSGLTACSILNISRIMGQAITLTELSITSSAAVPAYIIYTSGSTGSPKGVIIEQEGLINLIEGTREIYKINCEDRIPILHSTSFDVCAWEIFSALFNGAQICIPAHDTKYSPKEYFNFILDMKITIVNLTPSYFYLMQKTIEHTPDEKLASSHIRLVLLAGEVFHAKRIPAWFHSPLSKNARLFNMYGITEATIHSTYIEITPSNANKTASLIGKPLPGVYLQVVDQEGRVVTQDGTGEIYLSGSSISSGYLGQPKLSQEKFIEQTLDDRGPERWLKTGDFVTLGVDGLEYVGRQDKLCKIRGYRVNTTYIENILCTLKGVNNAVLITYPSADGQLRLAAFLVCQSQEINIEVITSHLKQQLPSYMWLSKIFIVKELYLTINGKIDTQRLVNEYMNFQGSSTDKSAEPTNMKKITQAWQLVLKTNTIDTDTNFFDAGGDSLLLAELQHHLHLLLKKEYRIFDLMRYPTIKSFSDFISNEN